MPNPYLFDRSQAMGLLPWDYQVPRPTAVAPPMGGGGLSPMERATGPANLPAGLPPAGRARGGRPDTGLRDRASYSPHVGRFDMPVGMQVGLGMLPGFGPALAMAKGAKAVLGPHAVFGGPVNPQVGTAAFDAVVAAGRAARDRNAGAHDGSTNTGGGTGGASHPGGRGDPGIGPQHGVGGGGRGGGRGGPSPGGPDPHGGGFHGGGPVSESLVPGRQGADVGATLQEGEHVMNREAVEMAGHMMFDFFNWAARQKR